MQTIIYHLHVFKHMHVYCSHLRIAVHIATVHADVGGQSPLALSQLATEASRGRLLGQALHVDGGVLTLNVDNGHGGGSSLQGVQGKAQLVSGPQLITEEGAGVDDGVTSLDARLGSIARH